MLILLHSSYFTLLRFFVVKGPLTNKSDVIITKDMRKIWTLIDHIRVCLLVRPTWVVTDHFS